jgi:hypothetical protein
MTSFVDLMRLLLVLLVVTKVVELMIYIFVPEISKVRKNMLAGFERHRERIIGLIRSGYVILAEIATGSVILSTLDEVLVQTALIEEKVQLVEVVRYINVLILLVFSNSSVITSPMAIVVGTWILKL